MAKFRCTVCNYVYDEAREKVSFSDLPKEWGVLSVVLPKAPLCF